MSGIATGPCARNCAERCCAPIIRRFIGHGHAGKRRSASSAETDRQFGGRRLDATSGNRADGVSPSVPARRERQGSYVPGIDGLRALAVLSVMLFHLRPAALPGGFAGVDVFFVISGFVVTKSLADRQFRSLWDLLSYFYVRRILRIIPAEKRIGRSPPCPVRRATAKPRSACPPASS